MFWEYLYECWTMNSGQIFFNYYKKTDIQHSGVAAVDEEGECWGHPSQRRSAEGGKINILSE